MRGRPDRRELLVITQKMREVEQQLPFCQLAFSMQMQRAIEADDYVVRGRPWHENEPSVGYLYIASAWSRPGLAKLGATCLDPQERLNRYAERYGYPVAAYWSASVPRPFSLENQMSRKLANARVDTGTYGDSRGWYRLRPAELKFIVERELEGW